MFSLSWISLIGKVDINYMPNIVLDQICKSQDISIGKLLYQNCKVVGRDLDNIVMQDLPYVARWINPDKNVKWSPISLMKSLNWIISVFEDPEIIMRDINFFKFGQMTSDDPISINPIISWYILSLNMIEVKKDIKEDELYNLFRSSLMMISNSSTDTSDLIITVDASTQTGDTSDIEIKLMSETSSERSIEYRNLMDLDIPSNISNTKINNVNSNIDSNTDSNTKINNVNSNTDSNTKINNEELKLNIINICCNFDRLSNDFKMLLSNIITNNKEELIIEPILPSSYDISKLINIGNLMINKRFNPKIKLVDKETAIVVAAIYFDTDISECPDPIRACKIILEGKPISKFPKLYEQFNFKLPLILYKPNYIDTFAENEGYRKDIKIDPYEYLQLASTTAWFFNDINLPHINKTTMIDLDDIDKLTNKEALWYGTKYPFKEGYILTYKELKETFESSKSFKNITSIGEYFSSVSICKLRLLAEINYPPLVDTIDMINQFQLVTDELNVLDKFKKEEIEEKLLFIMNLGFIMRGFRINYKDKNLKYPIELFSDDNSKLTEENTTEAIISILEDESELLKLIIKLPLLIYNSKSKIFIKSSSINNGLTILDRINIVNKADTENGCIRISSNWLISSSYYYMIKLNIEPPFLISDLYTYIG